MATAALPLLFGGAPASAAAGDPVATFRNYQAPGAGAGQAGSLADRAGEPTLGINPKTGNVMYIAFTEVLRVNGFDAAGPGTSTWTRTPFVLTDQRSFDPILETDPDTGRTFVSQLSLACSFAGFTDNDGASFTPSQGCGAGTLFDHQTVGFGRYVANSRLVKNPVTNYPNVVYYCAQDVVSAKCSSSTDGGITFNPGVPVYTTAECQLGGIFGHIKSAPDGTVYLPPRYLPGPRRQRVPDRRRGQWGQRPDLGRPRGARQRLRRCRPPLGRCGQQR